MVEVRVPAVGESISEVEIGDWLKRPGDPVRLDEPLVVLETEKASLELPAPAAGVLTAVRKQKGDHARIGEVIAELSPGPVAPPAAAAGPAAPAARGAGGAGSAPAPAPPGPAVSGEPPPARGAPVASPAAGPGPAPPSAPVAPPAGPRPDAARPAPAEAPPAEASAVPAPPPPAPVGRAPSPDGHERVERTVRMTPIRRRIAEKLVQAQQTAALLTTVNEVDMSEVAALRRRHQDRFRARHGVKLGIMPFFVRAVIEALRRTPALNAEVRGADIVFRDYFDIGIAVASSRGLVVPVLRDAERMGFPDIERTIAEFARRAESGGLMPDDLAGGTFTISNGGVFGSLLSTPIVNPPQSGILGLHAIQERPVVRAGQVVARPMMYVALTYDHRVVDGREAVTFLRSVKEMVEDPASLLLDL
jgi:2-oxoglutarate dehydrogenase E2 component (dihydrolipoamide succinyltransferase)